MKYSYILALLLLAGSARTQSTVLVGGGNYATPSVECVSPGQRLRIDSRLIANVRTLRAQGTCQRPGSAPL